MAVPCGPVPPAAPRIGASCLTRARPSGASFVLFLFFKRAAFWLDALGLPGSPFLLFSLPPGPRGGGQASVGGPLPFTGRAPSFRFRFGTGAPLAAGERAGRVSPGATSSRGSGGAAAALPSRALGLLLRGRFLRLCAGPRSGVGALPAPGSAAPFCCGGPASAPDRTRSGCRWFFFLFRFLF